MTRILLVDDDEDVRIMLSKMLQRHDHEVMTATNGNDALEKLHTFEPQLIITDMFMPEKEGLEAIVDLKAELPGVPIIAISGGWHGSSLDFLSVAESMGAARSLRKPIDNDELLAAINELVSQDAAEIAPVAENN